MRLTHADWYLAWADLRVVATEVGYKCVLQPLAGQRTIESRGRVPSGQEFQ